MQDDIDRFYVWCINNKLSLNIQNCKYIQFSKSCISSSQNYYFIKNMLIEKVDLIRDLGVLLDCKLTFTQHIENCCNKALKLLGFIKRHTRDFTNISVLKILYTSLVRSQLENCSSVWSPYFNVHMDKLDSVQRKFLRYVAFKKGTTIENLNYSNLELEIGFKTLSKCRDCKDIVFTHKILNGLVSSPDLLSQLQLHVLPRTFRDHQTFRLAKILQ